MKSLIFQILKISDRYNAKLVLEFNKSSLRKPSDNEYVSQKTPRWLSAFSMDCGPCPITLCWISLLMITGMIFWVGTKLLFYARHGGGHRLVLAHITRKGHVSFCYYWVPVVHSSNLSVVHPSLAFRILIKWSETTGRILIQLCRKGPLVAPFRIVSQLGHCY